MEYPIDDMMDKYCLYHQKYVMMTREFIRYMPHRYGRKQVWEHMNGNISLCVFSGPSVTSFMTFDIDLKDPAVVHSVVNTVAGLGIPMDRIYVSMSGGKGYHVDVFFSENIYNWKARMLYDLVIYFGNLNPRKVEFRPTPRQAIKLPLGVHRRTGNRCWFVDRDTLEPIENFDYIKSIEKVSSALVDEVLKLGNRKRFGQLKEKLSAAREPEPEPGPEKNARKHHGEIRIEEPGTRNSKMVQEALRLYRNGAGEDEIIAGLTAWLSKQDKSLYKDPEDVCLQDIDNITSWVMKHGVRKSTKFDPGREIPTSFTIYESDIRRILSYKKKSVRMLAFLITAQCDMYGTCGLGTEKMCELLGIKSNKTVVEASKELEASGMFIKKTGGYRNMGDKLRAVTNKYTFPEDYRRSGESKAYREFLTADLIRGELKKWNEKYDSGPAVRAE